MARNVCKIFYKWLNSCLPLTTFWAFLTCWLFGFCVEIIKNVILDKFFSVVNQYFQLMVTLAWTNFQSSIPRNLWVLAPLSAVYWLWYQSHALRIQLTFDSFKEWVEHRSTMQASLWLNTPMMPASFSVDKQLNILWITVKLVGPELLHEVVWARP